MKAVLWEEYGSPEGLKLRDIEKPVPGAGQALIKLHATTVNAGDCEIRALKLPFALSLSMRLFSGLIKPKRMKILGQDFAGEVEAVGKNVAKLKTGERVFGATGFGMGTYAEYMLIEEKMGDLVWSHIPKGISYETMAPISVSGLEAYEYLSRAKVAPGEHVLINGAGGSIGTFAIQLAKYYGAKITAVDLEQKFATMHTAGADNLIDYNRDDFTEGLKKYDVIFDVVGKSSYSACIKALRPRGRLLISNPTFGKMIRGLFTSITTDKKVIIGASPRKPEQLDFLKERVVNQDITPIIGKTFSLDEIPYAHRYAESGEKQGNIVISIK